MTNKPESKKIALDQRLSKYIDEAVNLTFTRMLELNAVLSTSRNDDQVTPLDGISGVLDVTQDSRAGLFLVTFPEPTIFALMSAFYGKPQTVINSSIEQGVCELCNVIYGQIKAKMNSEGHDLQGVRPRVLQGPGHAIVGAPALSLKVDFETPHGAFKVSFFLGASVQSNGAIAA